MGTGHSLIMMRFKTTMENIKKEKEKYRIFSISSLHAYGKLADFAHIHTKIASK
jgi:hypothetical protein